MYAAILVIRVLTKRSSQSCVCAAVLIFVVMDYAVVYVPQRTHRANIETAFHRGAMSQRILRLVLCNLQQCAVSFD